MKKILSIIITIAIVLSFSITVFAEGHEHNSNMPSIAKVFGMEGKIRIADPINRHDDEFNMALAFMQGDWDYTTNPQINPQDDWKAGRNYVPITYVAILGAFINQDIETIRRDGKYYILLNSGIKPRYSKEELMAQQTEVYNTAFDIYRTMHKGNIKDNMSQYEKAQKYINYCSKLGVKGSDAVLPHNSTQEDTIYMQYDSAWAGLVNHVADCGGKAAMMNVLLNMEGIKAYGVLGKIPGSPEWSMHVVTYAVLDGKEYTIDWGNGYGIREIGDKYIALDGDTLNSARVACEY